MVNLHELFTLPRKSVASLGELLPWFGLVSSKMVLCHDGSLLTGFTFEGADIEGVDDDQINHRIDFMQTAMRQLTDRCTMYSIQERRVVSDYPETAYTNQVARAIDDEWSRVCEINPNGRINHSLYISYRYPSKTEAFFEQLRTEMEQNESALAAIGNVLRNRFGEKSAVAGVRGQIAEMVEDFENIVSSFANIVVTSLGFVRLEGEHLLGDLYGRVNLGSEKGKLNMPDRPVYLNTLIPADDLVRQGDSLEFKGPARSTFCAALSTTGMPPEAHSLQIDRLLALPCEYVLVQSFQFIDRNLAQDTIQKAEQFYRTEVKSAAVRMFERITGMESDKVNTGNLALAQDAQEALVDVTAGDLMFGYYNMTILALGEDRRHVNRAVDMIASTLRAGGYGITRERQGLMSAFLGSLPGNSRTQLRRYLASSANVADLCPIRTISGGEAKHGLFSSVLQRDVPAHVRFPTPYGVPYDFNTHASDLGHAVVIGGSGSGKTTFMSLLFAQFQKYFPCQSYVFDKDYSMALTTVLLGGAHIDMASPKKTGIKINPVRRMLSDGEDLALVKWLGVLFASNEATLTPEEQEDLSSKIQQLKTLPEASWRLGTLYSLISGTNKKLALKLAPYVDRSDNEGGFAKGAFSDYFDNEEDALTLSNIACMETGKLLENPQVAAPFMDYAFYCIERKLNGTTPTFIYVEESWYMLANPIFEAKINDWLRTFRKKRAFVVFATQSPEELAKLKSWAAFVSNTPTRVFLPSINDSVAAMAPMYRELFGLNDAQLTLLSGAVPKRDYLLVKPGATRLVEASMPDILLAINEGTSRESIRNKALELAHEGGNEWQIKFLEEVLNVRV